MREWGPWLSVKQRPTTGEYVQIKMDYLGEPWGLIEGVVVFDEDGYWHIVGREPFNVFYQVNQWRRLIAKEYNPPLKSNKTMGYLDGYKD